MKEVKIKITGFVKPSCCAPMPIAGTIGWLTPKYANETPKGKKAVRFKRNFKSTDGGLTIENHLRNLFLFIPEENIEII